MSAQVLPKKRTTSNRRVGSSSSTRVSSDVQNTLFFSPSQRHSSHKRILSNNNNNHNNHSNYNNYNNNAGLANAGSANPGSNNSVNGKRVVSNRIISQSRHVSRSLASDDSFDDPGIGFNENKHQILSNFEEWIKLSTDNKITTKNSWQFALIDYFHDLNVIKDGDHINFQKASATLDGCMKIYANRIDSAATETGKLLSGLATKQANDINSHLNNNNNNNNIDVNYRRGENGEIEGVTNDDGDGDDGESAGHDGDTEDNEDSGGKKKRKMNRVVESTLVDFETIRIKKLDEELSIDPLFKKALAEFDEGGAKSLLLNTLSIDSSGRVVFDATSNQRKRTENKDAAWSEAEKEKEKEDDIDIDIDLESLSELIYAETNGIQFQEKSLCPSINEFQSALEDVNKARNIFNDFNNKIGVVATAQDIANSANEELYQMVDDDNDYGGGFDDYDPVGENAENGHNDFADYINESVMHKLFEEDTTASGPQSRPPAALLDEDLMNYFDEKMKLNWTGPEHWKVSAFKKANNIDQSHDKKVTPTISNKKKKERCVIEFFEIKNEDEDLLFKSHRDPNFINLKTTNAFDNSDIEILRELGEKNCLPNDIQFNSLRLISLIQKPRVQIMHYPSRSTIARESESGQMQTFTDSKFFADQYKERESQKQREEEEERRKAEAKLANSFNQDDYDDFDNEYNGLDFNDALECANTEMPHASMTDGGGADGGASGGGGGGGAGAGGVGDAGASGGESQSQYISSQIPRLNEGLITKRKSEFVNFSRVAKRVDIKLLKDNIWKAILEGRFSENEDSDQDNSVLRSIKFDEVIKRIKKMYKAEQFKELSTSFCFICVLHLANEHGLSIESNDQNDNLLIKGF
ncbi:BRN1 [Candida oxycetoniae]|uniref:Condensin complex subunit 2 n=1 Tax=Candida oxycetoniae TaxID=497107 RepID=A0AAI9T1J8_9ASCO|nr:BRN1 [Candida oxycetoniae]KAI3406674.2 BRN1 [Candida oxycetoniae]